MIRIEQIAKEGGKLDAIRQLFNEYQQELGEDLCFQGFEAELKNPLSKYGPPHGVLLLAFWGEQAVGCVALQPLAMKENCEMKRLYVQPAFRKYGIGKELVGRLLERAVKNGFKKMQLDTLSRLGPAIALYRQFGFTYSQAYYQNPMKEVVYMEKDLGQVPVGIQG